MSVASTKKLNPNIKFDSLSVDTYRQNAYDQAIAWSKNKSFCFKSMVFMHGIAGQARIRFEDWKHWSLGAIEECL